MCQRGPEGLVSCLPGTLTQEAWATGCLSELSWALGCMCVHALCLPRVYTVYLCVPVQFSPPRTPLSHELASQSLSHSREPLGMVTESGSPQVHTGQLTEGLWVGGSHNPGLTRGRGLGDTKSDSGCECTP